MYSNNVSGKTHRSWKGKHPSKSSRTNRDKELSRLLKNEWSQAIPSEVRNSIATTTLNLLRSDLSQNFDGDLLSYDECRTLQEVVQKGKQYIPVAERTGHSCAANLLLAKLFSKSQLTVEGVNRSDAALQSMLAYERQCARTNRRMVWYRRWDFTSRPLSKRLRLHEVFHLARRKICDVITSDPLYHLDALLDGIRFGPGGNLGISRPFTTAYHKLTSVPVKVTKDALPYLLLWATRNESFLRWVLRHEEHVRGDPTRVHLQDVIEGDSPVPVDFLERHAIATRAFMVVDQNYNSFSETVSFVPKDCLTDRSIAVGPCGNTMVQLSVGSWLKRRLSRVGIDLYDQSPNQKAAWVASITNADTTLDLKGASDCMSIEIVRELFPPEWFRFLEALRVKTYVLRTGDEANPETWQHFSSMGNGYTFEVETLLFWALSQACIDLAPKSSDVGMRATALVYGDDIIVPNCAVEHVKQVLSFCGFSTNVLKSFDSGPFRESCGEDYHRGLPVRPGYYTGALEDVKELISLHNIIKWTLVNRQLADYRESTALAFIRGVLPETLERELRTVYETRSPDALWVDDDDAQASSLVTFEVGYGMYRCPKITKTTEAVKTHLDGRYLQFLWHHARGQLDSYDYATKWLNRSASFPLPASQGGCEDSRYWESLLGVEGGSSSCEHVLIASEKTKLGYWPDAEPWYVTPIQG